MKQWFLGLMGGLSLVWLSGCTMLLEDTYSNVKAHTVAPISEDSQVISVENYYELVNAILYFVVEHQAEGVVRLEEYEKELAKTHLTEAVMEVIADTALGSYAVEGITWELNAILGNLEGTIFIDFHKTEEDYEKIVYVSGNSAIVRTLSHVVAEMHSGVVIQNSFGNSARSQVSALIHQALSETASTLVELPQIQMDFHPKEGDWRLVEFTFDYQLGEQVRQSRQASLEKKIKEITAKVWQMTDEDKIYESLALSLQDLSKVVDTGNTPYDVLVLRKGNSRGFALSNTALCQELGLVCRVIEGTLDGEPHYWNQVTLSSGDIHHLDVTREAEEGIQYFSDREMLAMGYDWNPLHAEVAVEFGLQEEE